MTEQQHKSDNPSPEFKNAGVKSQALIVYGRIMDGIVTALIFVMLLTLFGAVVGLVIDFLAAANALRNGVSTHTRSQYQAIREKH